MNGRCKCPPSFRYHAGSCAVSPDAVLNVALHKKCNEQEASLARLRRVLRARGLRRVLRARGSAPLPEADNA